MSKRMAVAQVGLDPAGKGGMAAVMRDLLASPLAERFELTPVVTWRGFRPGERLLVFLRALVSLARWCLRRGPRVAHIHMAARGSLYRKTLCVFLVRALRRPAILQLHAGPGDIEEFAARLGPLRRLWLRAGLRAAGRVLAVSQGSARTLERCFGIEGVGVVPNMAPAVPAEWAEATPADPPTVLYLGGFQNEVKGGVVLIEALGSLLAELPSAEFELAGPGEPPRALTELTAERPNVRWTGWLDEGAKREALGRCAVFVLPSTSEGLPVALLEAMAWGRAIVATRVGGVPDVVTDGEDAALVDPGDPRALAAAIRDLIDDPERRARLGCAARRRAEALNEDEVCGRLDRLYRELVR